jgi:hypothetical protein
MPRLSLYRPEKGADFRFLDRVINEEFQVGGTDIFVHKYAGPVNPATADSTPGVPVNDNPIPELGIQDLIFMENRDRHYEPDVYVLRGIHQMQDLDFNLSQFGLFLQNDNINMFFHLRSSVENLGRKIMSGDVLELPHLKDEYALDTATVALKRFYVVQDVTRPTAGFSQTWYPHLLRAKCVPLVDSQEYKEILDTETGDGTGSTLRDLLSTYNTDIAINDQIIEQANADAPSSGFDTTSYFVIPTSTSTGLISINDASTIDLDASVSQAAADASMILQSPGQDIYIGKGYLGGDGIPPNGAPYGFGISFPTGAVSGQFYLRTDYLPNRLYRYDGRNWMFFEQNVRMTLNNFGQQDVASGTFAGKQVRQTLKSGFINNTNTATINGQVVIERQALSKALKPKTDG